MKKQSYFCPACGGLSNRIDVCSICGSLFDENAAATAPLTSAALVPRGALRPVLWAHVTVDLERPGIPDDIVRPPDSPARKFRLEEEITPFGSGQHQEIRLFDEGASSRHGELVRMPDGGLGVRDLSSTNGTFIDGKDLRNNGSRLTVVSVGTIVILGVWTEIRIDDKE